MSMDLPPIADSNKPEPPPGPRRVLFVSMGDISPEAMGRIADQLRERLPQISDVVFTPGVAVTLHEFH